MEEDAESVVGVAKPKHLRRRPKPGTKALREIKLCQTSTKTIIPVRVMRRLLRANLDGHKIRQKAFEAIHASLEEYATSVFRGTQMLAIHAKRKTIQVGDMRTLLRTLSVMNGGADLNPEPVNPEMSRQHAKKAKARKPTPKRKKREAPILVPANLGSEIEIEDVTSNSNNTVVSVVTAVAAVVEPIDDDWFV